MTKVLSGLTYISIDCGYYTEHTKTALNEEQYKDFEDITEEESIDRLWVVVRSLKNPLGKIVITLH